ncbi:polysaccharide deacetylase [Geothrix limicola]|uniref:Polysaccharide deacetylase n=1 Tax=Geothrix limicola TaxID=2927978 RepID=A0ABQ5QFN9_9BACT|nr:polysaccharide deacetylase family protein [Geothrix limicola]GLH73627.1 polysaccharide deacetylase [Geothrix limicola]
MLPSRFFRAFGLALALTPAALTQSVAFTFDDGPRLQATPRLNPAQRNAALLAALKQHQVQAALFVTLGNGADQPEGLALARAWGEAGHLIGNHTVTHPDLDAATTTLAGYEGEIQTCDRVIRTLPGYRPWFRFTFLREGNTPEKRDGIRAFLKAQGYRNAYVSLDTSDWRLDEALRTRLASQPDADLGPFRSAYLAHLRQRAEAYRDLSRRLFGRDIPQVMLLHHNLINALFLGDALQQFKTLGWTFVSPEAAFQDFVYSLSPQRPAPGQSLLLSAARSLGYRPEGWERLVDDGDADIAALVKRGALPAAP